MGQFWRVFVIYFFAKSVLSKPLRLLKLENCLSFQNRLLILPFVASQLPWFLRCWLSLSIFFILFLRSHIDVWKLGLWQIGDDQFFFDNRVSGTILIFFKLEAVYFGLETVLVLLGELSDSVSFRFWDEVIKGYRGVVIEVVVNIEVDLGGHFRLFIIEERTGV